MAAGLIITIRETVRNALNRPLSGCLEPDGYDQSPNSLEWIAALYLAHPEERKKSVRWSRIMLLFHGLVIVIAVLSGFWLLPCLYALWSDHHSLSINCISKSIVFIVLSSAIYYL